ncbi:unnamed protein product [Sphagnum jensenii]|uniref:DCD domain-containing protein n=1 Tax=Sphagnum jensenii TaxID=128206 RepID=A0ABP1A6Q6_9BRYO
MVATKRSSTHVEFNPKQKGGGAGAGAGAGGGSSSSSSVVSEGGAAAALIEPLGGFIFVCNNDTMDEDFERHLFGFSLNSVCGFCNSGTSAKGCVGGMYVMA